MLLEPQDLEYLHDAVLHSVEHRFQPDGRVFLFSATFHEDSGFPKADGKRVVVCAREVTLVHSCAHGAVIGDECVSAFDFELSLEAQEILRRGNEAGLRKPAIGFRLATTSGSIWQVACEHLDVEAF